MGNAPSHHGGTPPASGDNTGPAPPGTLSSSSANKDKDVPALPPSPEPPQTPLLMPYSGHLSPQNPHALGLPQAHDYSKSVVTELILEQQLAPFYRGLDDFEDDWTEQDVARALSETRERDFAEQVENSFTARLREEREVVARGRRLDHEAERAERVRREDIAYLGAIECPICFLYYPPNINTSRCCQQPLCTECFVQIKRADATSTHLESEPASCPFCVETDFGVIYEKPTQTAPTPSGIASPVGEEGAGSALATSPEAGTSAFSNAYMAEQAASAAASGISAPTTRRKSVSSKAKEVVTIDCIRPDWEAKLNAVKAQAARRAARRIVMRQVGDRLIPIGYTSSRATGQADFSMSMPPEESSGGRRMRRTREREREMEEMMIMEAMRLSLLDHEEHQRKAAEERDKAAGTGASSSQPETSGSGNGNGKAPAHAAGTTSPTPSTSSRRSSGAANTLSSWRASEGGSNSGGGGGRAAKLLSKITVNRSRANSKSSVHFAPSPTTLGPASPSGSGAVSRARSSSTPSPVPPQTDCHHPSPLSSTVTTRRSMDVPVRSSGDSQPSSVQALQAAIAAPAEPTIRETSAEPPIQNEAPDTDTPLARELAAAAEVGGGVGDSLVESPVSELAPPPKVTAAPGQDLIDMDAGSGSAAPAVPAGAQTPTQAGRHDATPPTTDVPAESPALASDTASSLALGASSDPSSSTTPEPSPAALAAQTMPSLNTKVPQRADSMADSMMSVDAPSFVTDSSAGLATEEFVHRPNAPLASRVDDD